MRIAFHRAAMRVAVTPAGIHVLLQYLLMLGLFLGTLLRSQQSEHSPPGLDGDHARALPTHHAMPAAPVSFPAVVAWLVGPDRRYPNGQREYRCDAQPHDRLCSLLHACLLKLSRMKTSDSTVTQVPITPAHP